MNISYFKQLYFGIIYYSEKAVFFFYNIEDKDKLMEKMYFFLKAACKERRGVLSIINLYP